MFTARRETRRRIEALRRIPFLACCTPDELARIDQLGTPIQVQPGRTLIREGAAGRECFVTLQGVAIAERAGRPIGVVGAGSVAGEMALLEQTTRNATVVAATAMQLLVLSHREFEDLLKIAPRVEATFERIAAERHTAITASNEGIVDAVDLARPNHGDMEGQHVASRATNSIASEPGFSWR